MKECLSSSQFSSYSRNFEITQHWFRPRFNVRKYKINQAYDICSPYAQKLTEQYRMKCNFAWTKTISPLNGKAWRINSKNIKIKNIRSPRKSIQMNENVNRGFNISSTRENKCDSNINNYVVSALNLPKL